MHILLTCHALVGVAILLVVREEVGVLVAPDVFGRRVFDYAHKTFDIGCVQRRAVRRLQCAFAWHCLLTGFVHIYHAEHLRLWALREAAMSQPVPYGCGGNWDWDRLTLTERIRDTVLTDTVARCAEYLRLTTIDVYPNAIVVLLDTLILAPLRAVDSVADTLGTAVAHFLSHFSWLFQLVMVALVPVVALLAFLYWPAPTAVQPIQQRLRPKQIKDEENTLVIEEIDDDDDSSGGVVAHTTTWEKGE
jgi:hypothetical protein